MLTVTGSCCSAEPRLHRRCPGGTTAGPAVDLHDPPKTIAITVSSCQNCPGPEDENAGPLALASIDLTTVAAEIAAHLDEVSILIPMKGAEVEGSLALAAVVDHPMAEGHCCFPVSAGCPANGCGQMNVGLVA